MYKKESSLISSPDRNINISEATPGVPNTLARVNNRRKEQVTTFLDEGLPAISDSSFWYHLIKNNFILILKNWKIK